SEEINNDRSKSALASRRPPDKLLPSLKELNGGTAHISSPGLHLQAGQAPGCQQRTFLGARNYRVHCSPTHCRHWGPLRMLPTLAPTLLCEGRFARAVPTIDRSHRSKCAAEPSH